MSEFTAHVVPSVAPSPAGPIKIEPGKSYRDHAGDMLVDPKADYVGYWFLTNQRTGERERYLPGGKHWGAPGSVRDIAAEIPPAPSLAGRTPGRLRPARTGDVGRDLACRLYSAETGEFVASTETGQLPREQDLANAAFIRSAWDAHDALVEAATNARAVLGEVGETFLILDGGDQSAEGLAAVERRIAEIEAALTLAEGGAR